MKLKVLENNQNTLFKRKEVKVEIENPSTPDREEATNAIAQEFKATADAVKIMGIHGVFGTSVFKISANVYDSKEDKDAVELKKKKDTQREKKKEDAIKAAEEAKQKAKEDAAKPKEEPAAEDNKEEVKSE